MGGYVLINDSLVLWLHEDTEPSLVDYKIHCFNGVPLYTLVCMDRFSENGLTEDFYDENWKKMMLSRPQHPNSIQQIQMPSCYDQVLSLSSKLANKLCVC